MAKPTQIVPESDKRWLNDYAEVWRYPTTLDHPVAYFKKLAN